MFKLWTAVVLAAVLVAGCGSNTGSVPESEKMERKYAIAYIATGTKDAVQLVNSDGTGAGPLLNLEADYVAFSPDGQRIAFVRNKPAGLFVMNADGSEQRQVASDPEASYANPTFSPDGKRIAFRWYQDDCTIRIAEVDGGGVVSVVEPFGCGDNYIRPAFSADGREIALDMQLENSDFEGVLVNLETRALTRMPIPVGDEPNRPQYSPDGTQVVYQVDDVNDGVERSTIYIADVDGSNAREVVTTNDSEFVAPSFSPDGRYIAYSDRVEAEVKLQAIFVINTDGTNRVQVTHPRVDAAEYAAFGDISPVWTMSGA